VAQPADSPEQQDGAVTPLYSRLPRGPHHMKRGEVAENQRHRMQGAMVEAVAGQGYGGTSVKQVISLAGVSRRSFYEQFANKQECFLSTLELLAAQARERASAAYHAGGPDSEQRIDAGLRALLELVASNPKGTHMALLDASAAGPPGRAVLTKMLLGFERSLYECFASTPVASPSLADVPPGAAPLRAAPPAGVVRGVAGGVHMMILRRLCQERTSELPGLAEEVKGWMLAARSPAAARLPSNSSPARGSGSRLAVFQLDAERRASAHGLAGGGTALGGKLGPGRARILRGALDAIAAEGYWSLSPLGIVDQAEVSIDTFFSLFGDVERCVSLALASLSEELLGSLSRPDRQTPTPWPQRVRGALRSLTDHLAAHPSHVHVISTGAFEMGASGVEMSLGLAAKVSRALLDGAPGPPAACSASLAAEGVAGAVWHTMYCHAVHNRVEMLPASVDQLAYLVLAPFLGAERAVSELLGAATSAHEQSRPSDLTRRSAKRQISRAAL
jgi:AcrR family transcriptional regulator